MAKVEYDPVKDTINQRQHGISLRRAGEIEVLAFVEDDRADYREVRYRAYGVIDGKSHCLVFTLRDNQVRAISLRQAWPEEMRRYVRPS